MHSVGRVLAVVGIAAIALTCSDQTATGLRRAGHLAYLAITPVFAQAPQGGPSINVKKIKGTLKAANGTDSVQAEAPVQGDSAILEFDNVTIKGDSASFTLDVTALDTNNVVVFNGTQDVKIKPGTNAPAAPQMNYTAPDANVTTVDIVKGSPAASFTADTLYWAGAAPNDQTCLSRAPDATKTTSRQLTVVGKNAAGATIPTTVGWTSRDPSVLTVSAGGLVKAQCSNKSTYVVARTFLDVVDSVKYVVNAPAFSLTMSPDSTSLERGKTQQLTAIVTDENGNSTPASTVTWSSSDVTRATVNSSGLVTAIKNGRVLITAASGGRATIGVIQVVRPTAASVTVVPARDTLGFGQVRQYYAKALDALGQVIGDASGFTWSSSTSSATINAATGVATAASSAGSTVLTATIDGKSGTSTVNVVQLAPGTIKGIVKNGQTDAPLSGVTIASSSGASTVSAADGSYTLSNGVNIGDNLTASLSGYVSVSFLDAPAFPNQTVTVPTLPLAPNSPSTNGNISCKAINVLTNSAISNVTIKAYKELHSAPSAKSPNPTVANTATTDGNGSFTMSLPPGAYTLAGSAAGYSDGVGTAVALGGGATKNCTDLIMPPSALGSGLYVVLTWSQPTTGVPADLDLIMTGPKQVTSDTGRFQINSSVRSKVLASGDTVAAVDIIASGSNHGPEVIGLRPVSATGDYNFYVSNVSANGVSNTDLSNTAGARVDVYQDNHIIATFFPNSGQSGTLWQVFKYDGTRIFPGGNVITAANPPTVTLRAPMPTSTPILVPRRRE